MELTEWKVLGARPIGAYRLIRLEPPQPVAIAPGQFVMVLDPDGKAFLPRPVGPFPHPDGGVGVLVDPAHAVGALADARVLRVLGPLGRGFDMAAPWPRGRCSLPAASVSPSSPTCRT